MKFVSAAVLAAAILLAMPREANAWENLGSPPGGMLSDPNCLSRSLSRTNNRIDCFARGTDGAIWRFQWRNSTPVGWQSLGGQIIGDPECVSWAANRIDCFARNPNSEMLHWWFDEGSVFRGPENLQGPLTSNINCTSWAVSRIDCFARGEDRAMHHRWYNGSGWYGWEPLGGSITGAPECVSWAANRIDCFARGNRNMLFHRWWPAGLEWGAWHRIGGGSEFDPIEIDGRISCTSWSANRIDCFARTRVGMRHVWWSGSAWGDWEDLGGPLDGGRIASDPNCVSRTENRIDCFARASDGAIWRRQWDGSRWVPWETLGGTFTRRPECVSWGQNRIDCFVRDPDNRLNHRFWNGSTWLPAN